MTLMQLLLGWFVRNRRLLVRTGEATFAAVAVVALLILLLGPVTSWIGGSAVRHLTGKDKADAINGVRQTLLQAAAGTALIFTGLTFTLNRRGQVTDRYNKAVGLLASSKLTERISGIYALEQLMVESERDHEMVVQVLAEFVRDRAATSGAQADLWIYPPKALGNGESQSTLAADVQAALTVLSRRPKRCERQRIDLCNTNLRRANLHDAYLPGVNLDGANLESADLVGANLKGACMHKVNLERACLNGANLKRVDLLWANLKQAHLTRADLQCARLIRANLKFASLDKANLKRAVLYSADMRQAILVDADLMHANLRMANLESSYLRGANIEEADLHEATLSGANFQASL